MRIQCRVLALPKEGNTVEEYEDAAWPLRSVRRETRAFRCAVADGATETSFSGLWARLLVRAHSTRELRPARLVSDIARLQAEWRSRVGSRPLPWYAEEKLRSGAYSSLLGLSVEATGTWRALAVGDTCLVQVRGDVLFHAFPILRSEDFTNRPQLLSSNPAANGGLDGSVAVTSGEWQAGDVFYLMTDALAAWFLREAETGAQPWDELSTLAATPRPRFGQWVTRQRRSGAMRNDDVTLLRLVVE